MLKLNVKNETSRLRAVVLGTAISNGEIPSIAEAYDPKSLEHIAGTYPLKKIWWLRWSNKVLQKYNVTILDPN
jgi:hypothetical protein